MYFQIWPWPKDVTITPTNQSDAPALYALKPNPVGTKAKTNIICRSVFRNIVIQSNSDKNSCVALWIATLSLGAGILFFIGALFYLADYTPACSS